MDGIKKIESIGELKNIDWNSDYTTAYALNLCTVSVSQILHSNDQYIMEQEYNAILNNLNLKNMPDNPAILEVLKEILDVITFFKIQEGDKAFIEEEYEQEVRNALIKAINITSILGTLTSLSTPSTPVDWVRTGVTVVSQVGVGYMNYRNGKKSAAFNRKKNNWELQKAAIEQLNSLRRELFDAAWKMSKETNFEDSFRLTEIQIDQYNEILQDENVYSRYERLNFIKNNFLAYPPFWYHLGHAANIISQLETGIYEEEYKNTAITCFEYLIKSSKYNLLRDDQIVAACALEYAELINDKAEIKKCIDCAFNFSGNANDIIQLCAVGYLKNGYYEEAERLFKRLVNEQFNTDINAQILSMIYVRSYRDADAEKRAKIKHEHELLSQRIVHKEYILELPDEYSLADETYYYQEQMYAIKERCLKAVNIYSQLNKVRSFSLIVAGNDNVLFANNNDVNEEYRKYVNILKQEGKDGSWDYYKALLAERKLRIRITEFIWEYVDGLNTFIDVSDEDILAIRQAADLSEYNDYIQSVEEEIENDSLSIEGACDFLSKLNNQLNFVYSIRDVYSDIIGRKFASIEKDIMTTEKKEEAFSEIQRYELNLYRFCSENEIAIEEKKSNDDEEFLNARFINEDIFGENVGKTLRRDNLNYERHQEKINSIVAEIRSSRENLFFSNNRDDTNLIIRGDKEFNLLVSDYGLTKYKQNICAIIDITKNGLLKRRGSSESLALLSNGLLIIKSRDFSSYAELFYDPRHKYVIVGGYKYKCSKINIDGLQSLTLKLMNYDADSYDENSDYLSIEEMIGRAQKVVNNYAAAASCTGAIPLPFADMIPLVGEQVVMMMSISSIFGIHFEKDGLKQIATGVISTAGASLVGRNLVKLFLDVIPGGAFVASAISAAAAGTLTYGMGMAFIELCKSIRKGDISEKDIKTSVNFMSNHVQTNSDKYKDEYAQKVENNNIIMSEKEDVIHEKEIELDKVRNDVFEGIIDRNTASNKLHEKVLNEVCNSVDENGLTWEERIEKAKDSLNE